MSHEIQFTGEQKRKLFDRDRVIIRALVACIGACFLLAACEKNSKASQPTAPSTNYSDVTTFGAIAGDNINDQAAFAAAIQAAGIGGVIFVPKPATGSNVYIVDSIALSSGQTLQGPGRSSVVIRAATPGIGAGVRRQGDVELEIHVSGMSFENFNHGIDARGIYESHFEDIELTGNTVNVLLGNTPGQDAGSIWNVFERIKMSSAGERDLKVMCTNAAPVHLNVFDNCQFETKDAQGAPPESHMPLFDCPGGNGASGNSFRGNEFKNGIHIGNASGITFESNYFEGGNRQIILESIRGATIIGNYFHDWADAGVWINSNGVRGVIVQGNAFYGCPTCDPKLPAVRVASSGNNSCGDILVLGNAYTDCVRCIDEGGCIDPPCTGIIASLNSEATFFDGEPMGNNHSKTSIKHK